MVQVIRNLVQVALLVALGVALFLAIKLLSMPHLPLCELMPQWTPQWMLHVTDLLVSEDFCDVGDLAIWITVPATLLFVGRRRVIWVLAPSACLVLLHAWAKYDGTWPMVGIEEGPYTFSRTNWDAVRAAATQSVVFCVLAFLTYEISFRVPRAIGQLARWRPSLALAVGRVARRGLLIIGIAAAAFATVWFLFTFTIPYQLVTIRNEALDSTRDPGDKWAEVAREAGGEPAAVPSVEPGLPAPVAPELLDSGPPLSDVAPERKPCASDRIHADSSSEEAREAIQQCLSQRDGRSAGELFRGLLRVGRENDAVSLVESSAQDVDLDVTDYLGQGDRRESIQIGILAIKRLLSIVRERYMNGKNLYEMWRWQYELSRRLALAGDPDAAFAVLNGAPDGENEGAGAVADAFGRQGRFDRAVETLNAHGNKADAYKVVKGRLCLAMIKQHQLQACEPMVDQLNLLDHTKALALMGTELLRSGKRSEGLEMLDKAEDLAINASESSFSSNGDPVDEQTVAIFADAGRIRAAKLIADRLGGNQRASAYLLVLRHITGWRRVVGLAAARISNFLPSLRTEY